VIIEDAESAEDDIAQLIPKRTGSHLSQTQKNNLQKVKKDFRLIDNHGGASQERKEMVTSTTINQLNNDQSGAKKLNSLTHNNYSSGGNPSYSSKMSKTMSKNKMKLKLAADILNLKKDQVV